MLLPSWATWVGTTVGWSLCSRSTATTCSTPRFQVAVAALRLTVQPLHIAAAESQTDVMVNLVMRHGVDIDAQNAEGTAVSPPPARARTLVKLELEAGAEAYSRVKWLTLRAS